MTTNENPGCLTALLGWLGLGPGASGTSPSPTEEPSFPYHQRDDFLSPAEISFYHVLRTIVGDEAVVCPKVSLGDLFYAATGDYGENRSWMNRIDRKHVDFLICEPGSMRPTLAVELDDASHARPDRQERDAFVDQVFAAAGLPLARFPAQAQYNTNEVRARLREAVTGGAVSVGNGDQSGGEDELAAEVEIPRHRSASLGMTGLGDAAGPAAEGEAVVPPEEQAVEEETGAQPSAEAPEPPEEEDPAPPACPRCGATMVLREVKREGPNQGERFWGCPNFPKCRGTRELDEA